MVVGQVDLKMTTCRIIIMGVFLQSSGLKSSGVKSELTKYFEDGLEGDIPNFDILTWWKVHSSRLPILANIARELLAIPVSTVASESAFSTGGRVLDDYRSRLTARSVEALICTKSKSLRKLSENIFCKAHLMEIIRMSLLMRIEDKGDL